MGEHFVIYTVDGGAAVDDIKSEGVERLAGGVSVDNFSNGRGESTVYSNLNKNYLSGKIKWQKI